MAAGGNNLNPFSLDNQNKYGRRAHLLKPNLNIFYFQDGRESAIFKFFEPNFEYGAIFKLTKDYLNWRFF